MRLPHGSYRTKLIYAVFFVVSQVGVAVIFVLLLCFAAAMLGVWQEPPVTMLIGALLYTSAAVVLLRLVYAGSAWIDRRSP